MTSQENHHEQKKTGQFVMQPDNAENPTRLMLEIPLDTVAMDPTINGMVFMLGFFENAKNEAVALVRRKRTILAAAKSKIILPGGVPLQVQ